MSTFHLHISSTALRAAVVEQLKTLKPVPTIEITDSFTPSSHGDVIHLVDEAALDKKALRLLQGMRKDNLIGKVFLLGQADTTDSNLFTEIFRKPLRLGHLLARLHFHTETVMRLRNVAISFGPYRLEPQNRQIIRIADNEVIRLTEKETALLEYLGQSEHPVSRDELLTAIWGYDQAIETHTLETHIYQLRRKLDPDNTGENWLRNEQGAYSLHAVSISA